MPEKSIAEVSPACRDLFEKGSIALQRQNYDYAMTIFNQILEKEPGFYDCRESLRAAQYKRAAGGTSFFRKAFGNISAGPLLAKGQLALRSNPLEAIQIAEQILSNDPHSVMAHKLLAEAAMAADLPRTALLSLEIVHKNAPDDKHLRIKLVEALAFSGQMDRAEQMLASLVRENPDDNDLAQALKDLAARRTMAEGGYDALADGKGSYRDILKDEKESVKLEQEQREVKTDDVASNLIQEYEARVVREPDNLRLLRSLAELYAQKNEFDHALEYYAKLTSLSLGSDPSIDKAMSDTRLKKLDYALQTLNPQAPDYESKVAEIRAEKQAAQIADGQKRVEKYPADLMIKFEYGQLLFQAGRLSEAIQEFQKAQANPHRRVQSLHYLGLCFMRRNMLDLAVRALQNALKEKQTFDDEKKEIYYSLGQAYEKMGKKEEAMEQYKQIYEVDIGFKDVCAKVDAYYSSQQ
jgi:tetratricopeptide (TPR) repeat protein